MSTMEPPKSEGEPEKPAIATMVGTPTASSQHPPPSPLSGCYLLVVLPEPHNAQHKDLILNRIAKGFLSWDKDNCHVDLEKELQALVAQAPEGEEARNGERLIQYATENLVTEILIHPQSNTLLQCIRNLLASFTKHRHIIHAGYTFSENGSWILQDGTFSLADFLDAFNEHDVQRVLRAYENSVTVDINCAAIGEWSMQRLSKEPCVRSCRIRLNPDDVLTSGAPAITSFTNYISQYLVPLALDQLMQPSDVVGNIRFSHPTLYVFPGGQGDAALFGINGFNMLVDGGFARKSCFWDFTRHLDRLDAVLLTRINNSNVGGMSSVLRKKKEMQVYPQIGHFFCNLVERKHSNSPDGDKDLDPLILSLTELGQEMMLNLKHINIRPHPCYRDPEPINLYHKVGHGTLDMYVLSPSKDSREVREFLSKWNSGDWKLLGGSHKKDSNNLTFPIQNLVSICALLVWQPANPEDTITRILFPGSTPQHKIFEGIERLRHLEFLKHPRCTAKSISPSASLVGLKDKPMKIQKISLMDRDTKRAMEVRKHVKREEETKQKIELTQPEKVEEKPKSISKKREVVENKKIDGDVKDDGVRDVKKIDKELKDVKETKRIVKDDVKKTETIKTKPETEKTAAIRETKPRPERKEKKMTKEPVQKIQLPKVKADVTIEKKTKAPTPKKIVNGLSPKPEDKVKTTAPKLAPKTAAKVLPAAAPKSAKDANNRKVVEQKNIERMSMSKAPAKPKAPPAPSAEKKAVPRRPKPSGSPSKAKFTAGSPIKSAKSTPTASVKSDKDGVMRKIKTEKGTADSSTVSTPSAIEIDSMNKFTDKCLTEKSEDMSLDSIESKVLADLKEERQVVEEIEAVLQKAERIEVARKESRIDGEDEVTADATDKKDITEDMTEDDVTADIDEVPRKSPIRKASQELTEEEDEYLIIEKEEGDTEDSVHSGEAEHKHLLDAAQSEKEKILKEDQEYEEKEAVDEEELEPDELEEEEEEEEIDEEEDEGEEKEMAVEKGIMEEREKSDDASEKKVPPEVEKTPEKDTALEEFKEQLEEAMIGIITSAAEILLKTEDKEDSGKKDSEDITKEPSSLSPEKLDSSEKKTTDTDIKPELEKTKEKMEESQERISTIESGATTTAPTLPEDERISVDAAKPPTTEKTIEDKKVEVTQKPKEIIPLTTEPSEVKPDVRMFNVRQGPQVLQRDIVKTPDEVADLPVHEEVDPKLYKMEDFEKSKDEKAQVAVSAAQDQKESPGKEQKGVLGFFGKVADKFERGMDKLTGKGRRESEKDIDEKSSSKSGSPKEEVHVAAAPVVASEILPPKADEKATEKQQERPPEAAVPSAPQVLPQSEDPKPEVSLDGLEKSTEVLDDLEDADGVEALLEEASKKFKTVKDSLRDSLESLEEKIVEEEFKRAAELAASTKDEVKDTLEEVVEKLEEIQPQMRRVEVAEKEPEKVHFVVPADDEDEEDGTDLVRDMKEAVREVGEVLAGTAGIVLEEKPKDVTEIVRKVAEVLKEDDFLSDKALFKTSPEPADPVQKKEIQELAAKKASSSLECQEEPCIKKTVGEEPAISDSKEQTSDKTDAKVICEEFLKDSVPVPSLKDSPKHEQVDIMEAGIEEVCQKVVIPDPQAHQHPPDQSKDERRDSVEIEPTEISIEHKIAPTTAEYVMVTPDSVPPSPKFPSEKLQTQIEKEIASSSPRPGLPVEVQSIIESVKNIPEIIEELVFIRNEKITIEIIEYIILIKRVPREQVVHIIQEIIIKKKVPQESVVADANILLLSEQIKGVPDDVDEKDEIPDVKGEGRGPQDEDDSIVTDKTRSDVESEILNEYLNKNKKITQTIVEEIHVRRQVPTYVIIEIIEYIIVQKKLRKQSLVDIDDAAWEKLKTPDVDEEEEEEGKSVDEDQQLDDFIIVPSPEEVENLHCAESDILTSYIDKGRKITREIVEEIHITRKIPIYVVIELIEKIIITKKLSKNSVVDIPDAVWNTMKSDALKEEKLITEKLHDGFEAVEQEYKFSEEKDSLAAEEMDHEDALEDDGSDVIEADEKLLDKSSPDKLQDSVADKITEPQEKISSERKPSGPPLPEEAAVESPVTKAPAVPHPEADDEASTVRRMIVTTTSEDGGDEIVICPTGSITFARATTPEDSLKSSPIKTEPDKDSLRSHESTPDKDSISAKDSLDKSSTSIRDSQTLDDSIERSKTDDKRISDGPLVEEKLVKDLPLDKMDKEPSDVYKTEDASPAESVFPESPVKESSKSDVVDAKPISDGKTLPQEELEVVKDTMGKAEVALDKSRSSSVGSLTQDEVMTAAVDTSAGQGPIVKPDEKDIAHTTSTTVITVPSSDAADSELEKKSVADVEGKEVMTAATTVLSDKAVVVETEDKIMDVKSPSPGPGTPASPEPSPVSPDGGTIKKEDEKMKESGSSRPSSPISKETPVLEEKQQSILPKLDDKAPQSENLLSEKDKLEEKSMDAEDKIHRTHVEDVEADKVTSAARKPSVTLEKDGEDKKISALDTLVDHKPEEKGKIEGTTDDKSPVDTSPIKESAGAPPVSITHDKSSTLPEAPGSLDIKDLETVKDDIKHEEAAADAQKKSSTPSPTRVVSSKSSRDTSPIRKQSLLIDSADVKADAALEDGKSPALSVGDATSAKSSREVSPARKDSHVSEGEMKIDDEKSPVPSIADGKSSVSSRDISPIRKESSAVEKLDEQPTKPGTPSPAEVSMSPTRKESISQVEKEMTIEVAARPEEISSSPARSIPPSPARSIPPSPARSTSPGRKISLVVDEKVLPGTLPPDHEKTDLLHSPKSPGGLSPIRKQSIGTLEDAKVKDEADRSSPSPAESIKSSVSTRDTSPISTKILVAEERRSPSPRLSIEIESVEKTDEMKSPSALSPSVKPSTSPGAASPVRKESLASVEKSPTSTLEEKPADLKMGEVEVEEKSPSPVPCSRKSSVSPQDTSIKHETPVLEGKMPTSRGSVDLEPEEVALDKKSPSPLQGSTSSRETSPIRKESLAVSEKETASPRHSVDMTSSGSLGKVSPSSITESLKLASPGDTSPVKKTDPSIEETASLPSTTAIDSKSDEHDEKSSIPDSKVPISSPPTPSTDAKHEEIVHEKTPSPPEELPVSDTSKICVDGKHEEETVDKKPPTPGEKDAVADEKEKATPDVKVSVGDTPKVSIDIEKEEEPVGKEEPASSSEKDETTTRRDETTDESKKAPGVEVKPPVSDPLPGSIDAAVAKATPEKKTPSPDGQKEIQDEKDTPTAAVPISVSETPVTSMSKLEDKTVDEKTPAPGEKGESPEEKAIPTLDLEVSAGDTSRTPVDIKMEEVTVDKQQLSLDKQEESMKTKEESMKTKESPSSDTEKSAGDTAKVSVDIKMEEKVDDKQTSSFDKKEEIPDDQKIPSSEAKVEVSDTPRASIDIKMEKGSVDMEPPSPGVKEEESSDIKSEEDISDTKTSTQDEKITITDTPRTSVDIKLGEKVDDTPVPSPDDKVPTSGSPTVSSDIKHDVALAEKKAPVADEKASVSDTTSVPTGIKHEEGPDDQKTSSPEGSVIVSDAPRASIDIKHEEGSTEKKIPSPDDKVSVGGTPRGSIDIKHEEIIVDKKIPSSDEKPSVSDTPRASIDIKHEQATVDMKTPSLDEKVSVSGTPRASVDMQSPGASADKSTISQEEKVLMSETSKVSIDLKHDERADTGASPDGKSSISGSPRASVDIRHEEEISDKKSLSPDEKVSVSETRKSSTDDKHELETIDKKTPSPGEPVSPRSTSQPSIDAQSAEKSATSPVSPMALSPVKKASVSDHLDDKPDSHVDDKPGVPPTPAEDTVSEGQAPVGVVDAQVCSQKSPTVSPVRKDSLTKTPQPPETKTEDLKSSTSSRDVSPVGERLVPGGTVKSTDSSTIISVPGKESPIPDLLNTSAISTLSLELTEKVTDERAKSPVTSPGRKASLEGKSPEPSGIPPHQPEDLKDDTKSPGPKSPAPHLQDGALPQDTIEDLSTRSRSSSMTSEKSSIEPIKDVKATAKAAVKQSESPLHDDKSKTSSPMESLPEKPTLSADKQEAELSEAPSRDRSRSHSLFDTGEKTPLGRSRAASLFEDKDDVVKSVSQKSGLSEFHEDHFHKEDDFEVSEAKRIDVERYILNQYVTRKRKITGVTLEEIVALYDVPNYIVIETIYEICDRMKIPRDSIIDDVGVIEETQKDVSYGLSQTDKLSQISHTTRVSIEDHITQEYITKKKTISQKNLHEISTLKGVAEDDIFMIIESMMIERKIPRESLLEEEVFSTYSSRKSPSIREDDSHHHLEGFKEPAGPGVGSSQYKEEVMSGKSSPERRSSGYSTPEVRHYDDKYESQFHKAFVGGMTEIRTTHITTLSGKSTPDVGARTETPDSLADTASSDKLGKDHFEGDPVIVKRTIVTEVPEYETTIKKIVVKREIIEEDDDGGSDGPSITSGLDDKGTMKVDLTRSLMSSSSGRSTPDKIRDLSEGRSSTATPDSLRSHEVIKTTIIKTRTMSDEGEIITTTKEVTETTNERGETVVVEEKVDVKMTPADSAMETSGHQWTERHHEDSEEDSPLSATSQVYHYEKEDPKHVEFSPADMSSSFYGKLPDVPQPRHAAEHVGDDKDFSFKKLSQEKQSAEDPGEHMSTSQFTHEADYDVDKVLRGREKGHEGEDDGKDPIGGWGTPLKLPSPERPDKFNLRSTPIIRSSVDMSPDSLNFDVINDWGEPLRLPSPAPTADEASNKTMPPTPKKERRQPKKIVAENMKNKKRSDSPASKDKKKDSKKVQPVYLDLTYVPHHGNSYYTSLEFFKRVRARYYVFSGTEPSREVYDALLDAKKTWENKNLEVTMIPTYDTDTLGYWVADNEEALAANHIDLSPSASRCTINLQDHETSCSAYRLEF